MNTSPLRVLIDGRMLLGRFAGVGRVVTELVEQYAARDDIQPIVLCGNEAYLPWRDRGDIELLVSDFARRDRSPVRRFLWEETRLGHWVRRSGCDLYHATWNSGVPRGCAVPTVLTVHDIIPWNQPVRGFRARIDRACYRRGVASSVRRASMISTVSEYSRRELCKALNIDVLRVRTVHNGVRTVLASASMSGRFADLDGPFMLYVGGHEPRKNIAGLLRIFRAHWAQSGPKVALAITGTVDSLCGEARDAYDALTTSSRVVFLGRPTDTELAALYKTATAFMTLSLDEGFGLPALEAMAYGCPVIAANRASLPEVVGEAGILVVPDDMAGVLTAIERVTSDQCLRRSLTSRGLDRAARFGWSDVADGMIRLYRSAHRGELEAPAATLGGTRLA